MATSQQRPLAIITGASSGIGRELARCAAGHGFDLIVAADQPLGDAVAELQAFGAQVQPVEADLATMRGVDQLCAAAAGRPIAALLANAGHGLGGGFLEQNFDEVMHVINTNITGTLYLIQKIGRQMREQRHGRILITGSIAGYMPGTFQAVYNGTKAFIDSFALAVRNELKDTGVTMTCLMPGVTDTNFFERAGMMDTQVGTQDDKDDPAEVAQVGFKAMLDGDADVVVGLGNKWQVAMSGITPAEVLAQRHRKMAEPGSARK
jgi:uncharacterized protein